MTRNLSLLLGAFILMLLLAACGQSGPLYLPGDPSEVQNLPAQIPNSATERNEEEGDTENDDG
jgi:predicted small lipoprotein YifL